MSEKIKTLNIGEKVPDFEAPATSEINFKLSNYKSKSNVVIYFYQKTVRLVALLKVKIFVIYMTSLNHMTLKFLVFLKIR